MNLEQLLRTINALVDRMGEEMNTPEFRAQVAAELAEEKAAKLRRMRREAIGQIRSALSKLDAEIDAAEAAGQIRRFELLCRQAEILESNLDKIKEA